MTGTEITRYYHADWIAHCNAIINWVGGWKLEQPGGGQRLTWGDLTGPDMAVQEWHWLWGVSNTCYTLGDSILTAAWELPIPLSDCTLLPCVRLTLDANTGEQEQGQGARRAGERKQEITSLHPHIAPSSLSTLSILAQVHASNLGIIEYHSWQQAVVIKLKSAMNTNQSPKNIS